MIYLLSLLCIYYYVNITARRIMGLVVDEDAIISKHDESNVRQSRRIAQIKIKEEAERRKVEEITLTHLKQESQKKRKSKNDDKEFKVSYKIKYFQ